MQPLRLVRMFVLDVEIWLVRMHKFGLDVEICLVRMEDVGLWDLWPLVCSYYNLLMIHLFVLDVVQWDLLMRIFHLY